MTDSVIGSPDRSGDAAGDSVMVSVTELCHTYPAATVPALEHINLRIPAGSCFGLLGPNGAGKTTLISLLTGVLKLQQGCISVAGCEFSEAAKAIKSCSALVPQDYAFYPTLTGLENLEFFAGLYCVPKAQRQQRLQFCTEVCSLQSVLHLRAENYSGGIKRRLNIAIGLLCNPKVLYLDEPTVGIDAQSRRFILESIERLKNSGMTIIYTSHYMEEVEQICDEVAIIDHGKVLLQKPMSELLQSSRQLLLSPEAIPSDIILDSLRSQCDCEWDGKCLQLTLGNKPLSELISLVEAQGISIAQIQMAHNRLEDIYLATTSHELRV